MDRFNFLEITHQVLKILELLKLGNIGIIKLENLSEILNLVKLLEDRKTSWTASRSRIQFGVPGVHFGVFFGNMKDSKK